MTTNDRLDEIEARLSAAKSAASDQWEVGGLTTHGGYAVVATDALDVSTDEYLPEEVAEMFAHAPADLAALVTVVREVEALHRRTEMVGMPGKFACSTCGDEGWDLEATWPCPTAAAVQKLGGGS